MNVESRRTWHAIQDVLGSKWAFHVVGVLAEAEHGFNELRRRLDGVTAKTLSARLTELQCLGIVEKEVHATSPPTTTYRLTEQGESLADVMAEVETFIDLVDCPDEDCSIPMAAAATCSSDC